MKPVQVLDMADEIDQLKPDLMAAFEAVLDSGSFIMGPNVKLFEQEVADYLGVNHAISLNSGTDALVLALMAADIGPGDEVITTPFTFFATAEAISKVGATPVFVDVEMATYNMNLDQLEAAVTPRTKAIIPVHLFGQPVQMDRLMAIAGSYGLLVVEDAAQAFGSSLGGRMTGTIGDIGCYSFFPSKNLGAYGDGGLLTTNNADYAAKVAMLRVHGSRKKYHNEIVGFNSRLDELQAAVLRIKLPRLDSWNEGRRRAADEYAKLLSGVDGVITPSEAAYGGKHVYHQYTVRILGGKRDEVQEKLQQDGVMSMIYYPVPVHQLPVYASLRMRMPIAEQLSGEVLSLPLWPQIQSHTLRYVADRLIAAL